MHAYTESDMECIYTSINFIVGLTKSRLGSKSDVEQDSDGESAVHEIDLSTQ